MAAARALHRAAEVGRSSSRPPKTGRRSRAIVSQPQTRRLRDRVPACELDPAPKRCLSDEKGRCRGARSWDVRRNGTEPSGGRPTDPTSPSIPCPSRPAPLPALGLAKSMPGSSSTAACWTMRAHRRGGSRSAHPLLVLAVIHHAPSEGSVQSMPPRNRINRDGIRCSGFLRR
jgi:hypothetical protein